MTTPAHRLSRLPARVAALALATVALGLAPEPDPVPRRWQLTVEPGPMRILTVETPEIGPRAYFYFTYKVTNNSGTDLVFAPAFELATDESPAARSGRNVPSGVTQAVLAALDNPFLEDQVQIPGMLLQGEDNAKEGLVVWPADDLNIDELALYAAGFSGETKSIDVIDPGTKSPAKVLLRKQLMVRYGVPGDLFRQNSDPLMIAERRWILR